MEDLIGQSLGRYHIIEKLGEGGMAVVYKAYDTRLERDVALKVIRKDAFPPNIMERMLKRFEREAKSMAKLSHANIMKIHDFGEHEGSPYLVMELLSGGTLKEQMGSPLPWQQAVSLLEPIGRALAYAHGEGILHRDVKPANILITKAGEPVLTDFGIAKLLETEENNSLTGTGVGVGTPEYMAPEQGMGKEVDGRADVYALGIVLYELVTGHKPFCADTPLAVLLKQVNDPLPKPRAFVAELPDSLEKVLYKALAKNPDDRYQSMDDFVSALKKLKDLPVNKKIQQPVKKSKAHAGEQSDGFATTDLIESGGNVRSGKRNRRKATQSGGGSRQTLKLAGIVLGGLAVVVLTIGAVSGWFSAKVPATTQAPALTEAPAETEAPDGIGSTMVSDVDGMTMVNVPAGEFLMGSVEGVGNDDEHPQHTVYLDAYWIDQTEITNGQYAQCVKAGACTEPADFSSYTRDSYYNNPQYTDYPVIWVNWYQSNAYCEWAGEELPTEAQWEKAARGTDERSYPWGGSEPSPNLTNFGGIQGDTTSVESYIEGASPYGALDMAGNVWEWVADWYDEDNYENQSDLSNPQGPESGGDRVIRGGSWSSNEVNIRSSIRKWDFPTYSFNFVGFRCVLNKDINTSQVKITEAPVQTSAATETAATESPNGIGSTMVSEKDGMTMVYVPAGEFIMGSPEGVGNDDEHPQHTVYLDAFWIDQTEVTNAMFAKFLSDQGNQSIGGNTWLNAANEDVKIHQNGEVWKVVSGYEEHPVIEVSWYGAAAYCEWVGRQLPTEAQWEKAARGTDGRAYPWGNQEPTANLANYGQILGDNTAVGRYAEGASPYGALDMAGNAWEWVADWFGESYYANEKDWHNPQGPRSGEFRVLRGGSWSSYGFSLRSTDRFWHDPSVKENVIGFRCGKNEYLTTDQVLTTEVPAETSAATETALGIGSTMVSDVDGMTQMYVPAGEFLMGSPEGVGDDDEHPQHTVYLDAYWIDQTEVTNAMYTRCFSAGACTSPSDFSSSTSNSYYDYQYADYPVIWVNWDQANTYCEWAGRQLPTEAQWEKAARGTDGRTYPWGDQDPTANLANSNRIKGDTTAVGIYPDGRSPYGVLDMAGNVWEWVADWYGEDYYASRNEGGNPKGPNAGYYRVLRGGSWDYNDNDLRSANRDWSNSSDTYSNGGFRCSISGSVSP